MDIYDARLCALGEGPLWHPERQQLFWFDILSKRLLWQEDGEARSAQFDAHYSAAGWIDADTLLMASETALWRYDIATGAQDHICPLEAQTAVTRSNDGRADPWGGFWIGSMGKATEPRVGAIWRFYKGDLRKIVTDVTVANAICFAPDRSRAYYTDTVTQKIMAQPVSAEDGWPSGPPNVFVDLTQTRLFPDGAVTDALGNVWCAMWGAACVVCFDPGGNEIRRIDVPARQPTCPAFGGPQLCDLYLTSARDGLGDADHEKRPLNGATFVLRDVAQGLPEPKVIL